jgi:hypothetical protein
MPRGRFRLEMNRLTVLTLLAGGLLASATGMGELVVFQEGRVVKADTYRVIGDQLEIGLAGGGSYRVDLDRVERIVDDEVVISDIEVRQDGRGKPVSYDLSYREDRKPLFNTPYDRMISIEAKRFGVDASLVSALIRAESNYEPRAVSRKGARGLMQLMPATARRLSVAYPFDPVSNVRGGVRYLKELLDRFDHRPELVLAAYNAGENAVETFGGVPPYRETVGYVKRILSWWTPAVAAAVAAPSSLKAAVKADR